MKCNFKETRIYTTLLGKCSNKITLECVAKIKKGLLLSEIMIVVAICALLAAIVIPNVLRSKMMNDAREQLISEGINPTEEEIKKRFNLLLEEWEYKPNKPNKPLFKKPKPEKYIVTEFEKDFGKF